MSHKESSVHGKLDSIIEWQKQLSDRQKSLEDAIIGTANNPGLCEKVRVLQSENAKQAALISAGVFTILATGWSYIKSKLGLQ